jgi:hypothetical protein
MSYITFGWSVFATSLLLVIIAGGLPLTNDKKKQFSINI